MSNRLSQQTSPYLLQHADNPIDWYPWCDEAFEKAKKEDKPIFLSIGYSTCHWCHVMAHESFEDKEVSDILNKCYVCIKVDREERPDIDSIYMSVCQAFTGSGGWPMSIFMSFDQIPFYAGTYFPKNSYRGNIGFLELLHAVKEAWDGERESLSKTASKIKQALMSETKSSEKPNRDVLQKATEQFRHSFDKTYGGFGSSPKFPAAHNLIFLMHLYVKHGDKYLLYIAEKTLIQLYKGGIFDHIGGGFCRYSTDRYFLVPHFEKMLYDNALLIISYCMAHDITGKDIYFEIAQKTASYLMRDMTNSEGAFYSAQDADSDGVEGKYYLFTSDDINSVLGDEIGTGFCEYYSISKSNSIPNLLKSDTTEKYDEYMPALRKYRDKRCKLNVDDLILTSWNTFAVSALCSLYRVSGDEAYIKAALKTMRFIMENLYENETIYASIRDGRRGAKGYIDDYAGYIYALISLYESLLDSSYLKLAEEMMRKTIIEFFDSEYGGFYLYSNDHEKLITRPKESIDGAIPSGNSLMTYNLIRLYHTTLNNEFVNIIEKQLGFMTAEAKLYPSGYSMFLIALSDYLDPPEILTVLMGRKGVKLPIKRWQGVLRVERHEEDVSRFIICRDNSCGIPMSETEFLSRL